MQTEGILNQLYILGELSIYLGLFIVLVALALALFSLAAKWRAESLGAEVDAMRAWYAAGRQISIDEAFSGKEPYFPPSGFQAPAKAAEYFDV